MESSTGEPRVSFRTTVLAAGKTATGVEVPPDAVEALGAGKRPPVRVTINGYTYRNTVAVMGGKYLVGISAEHRNGAGVGAGDDIDVELVLDTAPRDVSVPPDFAAVLAANPAAKDAFERLSYSRKLGLVQPIEAAKTQATRERRIEKAIIELTP
jgi:hypothetical protein